MPIAMNFDLLANTHHQDKYQHKHEWQTNLEIKLSKAPLSNGTNRPIASINLPPPPPTKPRIRQILTRIPRKVNLEQLSRCSSTQAIDLPKFENEKWLALASSSEYVLIGGGSSSALRLFDLQGKEIRLININTFAAFDLTWSSVLNAFLIAGYHGLQMYSVENNLLTTVDNIVLKDPKDSYFWSITCHGNDAFIVLSDGLESVWRLSLPSFKRVQTLSGSQIRESDSDDRISCIRTNGFSIGMALRQYNTNQWRVDLFDYATMTRTHRGLTIGYGIGSFNFTERCMLAPIDDHQWLITGGYRVTPNALTLMDDRTGEIKQVERQSDRQVELIANICTSENSKQQQIINMIVMNNRTGQRQMHIIKQ